MSEPSKKTAIEPIYDKYKNQIDAIVSEIGDSYNKSAAIISWLYGGSPESWRKFLPRQKSQSMPKEVKEFLAKFKKK